MWTCLLNLGLPKIQMMVVGKVCHGNKEAKGTCDQGLLGCFHCTVIITSIIEYSWIYVYLSLLGMLISTKGDALDKKRAIYKEVLLPIAQMGKVS